MRAARLLVVLGALSACRETPRKPSVIAPPAASGRSWKTPPQEKSNGGAASLRLPRVVNRGGQFLRNPRIVTVTFKGEDPSLAARLEQFGDTITRSSWWREVVDSYCVTPTDCIGEARSAAPARLDEAVPATMRDVDVEELLVRTAKGGALGPLDRETLLLVYLPKGTALTDAVGPYCAGGPRGLHRALEVGDKMVAFAILPRCGDESELTATASHELIEATTNPDPAMHGFAFERSSANLGFMMSGVEPVDPCGLITMDDHRTHAGGFVVQRAWSNRAAALGHDPCVPSRPDRPYLALVPRTPTVRLPNEGASATIVLDAVADRPLPGPDTTWSVQAFDLTGRQEHARYVDVSLDKTSVAPGESMSLTIVVRKRHEAEQSVVAIVSKLGTTSHMWPVAVVMR